MIVDLHSHSTASDGVLTPSQLVERAKAQGVELFSVTDHDTISGLGEASLAARRHKIRLVSGIEFTCLWNKMVFHILAYNFDPEHPAIQDAVKYQTRIRFQRGEAIAEKLQQKFNFHGLADSVTGLCGEKPPGRPHFARAMVSLGYVKTEQEAFSKYLGIGKPGDIKVAWPNLEETMTWLSEAGAVTVLAHPRKYGITLTKLRGFIDAFKQLRGHGLEVTTAGQKQGEVGLLADLCQRYGLVGSVGSDFHSPGRPWCELGRSLQLPGSVEPVWSLF
ncbi:PHP domain-containing protein [Oleiphilus messinensis]|nr:PHP domain-containing protein [Oleiphilus messinensis]